MEEDLHCYYSGLPSPMAYKRSDSRQVILSDMGLADYYPGFLNEGEASALFDRLCDSIEWRQETIKIYGREILQPRLTAFYGAPGLSYTYSGRTMQAIPFTNDLKDLLHAVEDYTGSLYNSALINFYRNGNDSMAWHRDNEKELGSDPDIASVSLGAVRPFVFRKYRDNKQKYNVLLGHGSLLHMYGACQTHWEHCIPKSLKINDARINLTFRNIKTN